MGTPQERDIALARIAAVDRGYKADDFDFILPDNYNEGFPISVTYKPVGIKRVFAGGRGGEAAIWLKAFEFDLDYDRFRDETDSRILERETRIELLRQSHNMRLRDWEMKHDFNIRKWETKYNNQLAWLAEQQRGLLSLATLGMKSTSILNAGAIVAILQFIHQEKQGGNLIRDLGYALEVFLFGLFFSFILLVCGYHAQLYYSNYLAANERAQKIGNRKIGEYWRYGALACALISAVCFLAGGEIAINVLLHGKSWFVQFFDCIGDFLHSMVKLLGNLSFPIIVKPHQE